MTAIEYKSPKTPSELEDENVKLRAENKNLIANYEIKKLLEMCRDLYILRFDIRWIGNSLWRRMRNTSLATYAIRNTAVNRHVRARQRI